MLSRIDDRTKSFLAILLALCGLAVFIFFSVQSAHAMVVTMDEGTYLLKGAWFLKGLYRPFEPGGPVTNKMPLSFLVPGISQILFEPGIRSGRYFSLFEGLVMLVGLWLTTWKVSKNLGWAAAIVWLTAINQNWVMYYARPMSQVTTAMFLVWSLYFLLGAQKKRWELALGLALACLVALTRQNMVTFLFFAGLYVVWAEGLKTGLRAALPAILIFLSVHILYWPGIYLMMWRSVMPGIVTTQLANWGWLGDRVAAIGIPPAPVTYNSIQIVQALFGGVRFSLIPVIFTIIILLFYPFRALASSSNFKQTLFLLSNFIVLTILHVYAVLKQNTILYSFPSYFTFFNPTALLLLPLAYSSLSRKISFLKTSLTACLLLIVSAGVGLHLYREISAPILSFALPRLRNFHLESGSAELWRILANKFQWEYKTQEYLLTALAGLLFGLLLMGLALAIWLYLRKKLPWSYGWVLALTFTLTATLFLPTRLSGADTAFACDKDAIASFEIAGKALADTIPAGSLVYWDTHTSPSPALLLYLPQVRTFPVLLNGHFYYRTGISKEVALRGNYWTDEVAQAWIQESDFALLSDQAAAYWEPLIRTTYNGQFDQLQPTPPVFLCDPKSFLRIYQVIKK
jgi:hypothetical protein